MFSYGPTPLQTAGQPRTARQSPWPSKHNPLNRRVPSRRSSPENCGGALRISAPQLRGAPSEHARPTLQREGPRTCIPRDGSPGLAWCCSPSCKSCRSSQAASRRVCKRSAYSAVGASASGSATLGAAAAGAGPTGILSSAGGSKTPRSRKRAPFRRHPGCEHRLPPKYGSGSTE